MSGTAETMSSAPQTSESFQRGPHLLFDRHLRIFSESYIQFFQERKKIEEAYVDALSKLHRKTCAIDSYLEERGELSTTRAVWREVRDNVEREVQTRSAFLASFKVDVLEPLVALKGTQERTRKRIKEDLKESTTAHNEYAEVTLPKLKRAYLRKCQETDDYKASPTPGLPPISLPGLEDQPSTKSPIAAPHPLRPLERRPSGSFIPGRQRTPPSTSTALSDLASQGKKQFNQLITFLDKSGNKELQSGHRSDSTIRAVRSKREADEADKDYRKGVHWLETLRIKRVKTLENGYLSLEMFVQEASVKVKTALEKYMDNLIATTSTQTQLANHARSMVDKISPGKDLSAIAAKNRRNLPLESPKPVFYYNYYVGESRDLLFGVSLVDYATARGLPDGEIPKIVRLCIQEIDERGLTFEGIYRVSGRHAAVQELQHKIERDEQAFKFNPVTDDVTAVSSLFKLYLRELPEPLFRFPLQDRLQHSEDIAEHASNNFTLLRSKIRRLPGIHQATLKALVEHLARVVVNNEKNKMDTKNLAISFGTAIFGEDELPKPQNLLSVQNWKDSVMEDLISNSSILFDDRTVDNSPKADSPPLPPAPLGESVPPITYGSSHTRFRSVPTLDAVPVSSDFAPLLPPRPMDSIHPSLRAGHAPPRARSLSPSRPPPLSAGSGNIADNASPTPEKPATAVQEDTRVPRHRNSSLPDPPSDEVPGPEVVDASKSTEA